MSGIVLINPQNEFASFKTFEVLSLGYLASYLEGSGWQVSVYDCNFEDPTPQAIAYFCQAHDAAAVGFTSMVGTLRNVFRAATAIRRRLPDVPIVCGGYSATFETDLILNECPAIDFVFRGEGELSFVHWLRLLFGGASSPDSFLETPGLAYRARGAIRKVPGPILLDDLDRLPFPRRSEHLDEIGLASILSSRGCSAACSFCSIQEFYRISARRGPIRCRSARNVVDEIEAIHSRHGIERFLFIDDNFFMSERFSPGRLSQIARELVDRRLQHIRFEVSSRSVDLKLPELEALIEEGLDLVYLGIESGSASQLKRYRKGCSPERNANAVRELRARGVRIDFGFIPFDPYLEPDELIDSFRFLLENELITPQTVNTLTVTANLFPGTPLHENALRDGLLHRTEDHYYWFSFQNRTMAPVYEEIIGYFKGRYVMNVIDAYANGVRQKGFSGPGMDAVTPWLRRMCELWIARAEALLSHKPTHADDDAIEQLEAFVANALSAHLLLNSSSRAARTLDAQSAGLKQVEADSLELDRALTGNSVPESWTALFRIEQRYRERRDPLLVSAGQAQTLLPHPKEPSFVVCRTECRVQLIDVFVPPDIDILPPTAARPSDMPPPMLYLGSVTGMPPIECQLLDGEGAQG